MRGKKAKRIMNLVLSVAMVLGNIGAAPVYAETVTGSSGETIGNMIGNRDMKAYGTALENGTMTPLVTKTDTPAGIGTTYYLDSENGSDNNNGISVNTAWKTTAKINGTIFQAGDRILLKAGGEWKLDGTQNPTLHPLGSGTESAPIIISSYGEGDMPKLIGNGGVEYGGVNDVIYLYNQKYWSISNLDISNTAPALAGMGNIIRNNANGEHLKDVRGIRIAGQDMGRLDGFYLKNLYIHDVTGRVAWVSGTDSGSLGTGIHMGYGWNGAKRTGGIIFEILEPDAGNPVVTTFNDVVIEKSVINNNSFGGILFKQWYGDTKETEWLQRDDGTRNGPNYDCPYWNPHTNVVIQDNYISQAGSEYACNGILLAGVKHAAVQRNVCNSAGVSGIELCYTDDTVIQYNEVYDTISKAGGADSNAIDPDRGATNALIQYNYVHGNGDGILLCGFFFGSAIVRYNVIQDSQKRYINPHGDRGVNYVYNNIFYNTLEKSHIPFVESSGGNSKYLTKPGNMHYFYNNIFYNAATTNNSVGIGEGVGTEYSNNCYYGKGVIAPSDDTQAIYSNPQFLVEGVPANGEELENIQLMETSPLINSGINGDRLVSESGKFERLTFEIIKQDLFGKPIYNQEPDIGVYEHQGTEGSGVVNGYVYDEYGYKVEGAAVNVSGTDISVITDKNGYYVITGLAEGKYSLTANMTNYENGASADVMVESRKVISQSLTLGTSTSAVGTISGVVKNVGGGIAGAVVSLEGTDFTTKTDGSGSFTFSEVPVDMANGYTIKTVKIGYVTSVLENVLVRPGAVTDLSLILSKDVNSTEYKINIDFDDYETGTFSGNDDLGVYISNASNAKVEVVEENNRNYLKIEKTGSASADVYTLEDLGLTGTVTVDARVKRTSAGSSNQFGMYSYNRADWSSSIPPDSSTNPIATFALSKGNIITHNVTGNSTSVNVFKYLLDQWYTIRNVVNLDQGTFDFYVDDMVTPVLTNQPLRTINKSLDRFLFFSNSSNTGDLCIDYFRVCIGAPYDHNDASLLGLQVEHVELEEISDTEYAALHAVPAYTTSVKVTPKSGMGSVVVDGMEYDGVNPVEVFLEVGENVIPIVVTAEDGVTTKEYTLTISRMNPASEAYLKTLEVKEADIAPAFDSDTEEGYKAKVESDVEEIQLNYTKATEECTIELEVNGEKQTENTVRLVEGENIIKIRVGSSDGTNYMTYTVTVTREEPQEPNPNVIDKRILEASIQTAKTLDGSKYTEESYERVETAVREAEEVLADTQAIQEEVAEAIKELNDAIDALEEKDVKTSGLKLNYSKITVKKGTKFTWLSAVFIPDNTTDQTLTWTSSDSEIASVDSSGVISAKKIGTAKITAKSSDGKTASVKVKVQTNGVKVSKIALDEKEQTVTVGDEVTLNAVIAPVNATNSKVTWSSSDKKVAKVSSQGIVTAIGAGKAKITVTAKDGSHKKATFTITVED